MKCRVVATSPVSEVARCRSVEMSRCRRYFCICVKDPVSGVRTMHACGLGQTHARRNHAGVPFSQPSTCIARSGRASCPGLRAGGPPASLARGPRAGAGGQKMRQHFGLASLLGKLLPPRSRPEPAPPARPVRGGAHLTPPGAPPGGVLHKAVPLDDNAVPRVAKPVVRGEHVSVLRGVVYRDDYRDCEKVEVVSAGAPRRCGELHRAVVFP